MIDNKIDEMFVIVGSFAVNYTVACNWPLEVVIVHETIVQQQEDYVQHTHNHNISKYALYVPVPVKCTHTHND